MKWSIHSNDFLFRPTDLLPDSFLLSSVFRPLFRWSLSVSPSVYVSVSALFDYACIYIDLCLSVRVPCSFSLFSKLYRSMNYDIFKYWGGGRIQNFSRSKIVVISKCQIGVLSDSTSFLPAFFPSYLFNCVRFLALLPSFIHLSACDFTSDPFILSCSSYLRSLRHL